MSSFEVIQHGDSYIELIEDFPCERKEQLLRREGEVIRASECVNIRIAGRTDAEYYKDNAERYKRYRQEPENAEKIAQYQKQYRKDHVEKAKQYSAEYRKANAAKNKQKVVCECGATVTRGCLTKHRKTTKHIRDFIWS